MARHRHASRRVEARKRRPRRRRQPRRSHRQRAPPRTRRGHWSSERGGSGGPSRTAGRSAARTGCTGMASVGYAKRRVETGACGSNKNTPMCEARSAKIRQTTEGGLDTRATNYENERQESTKRQERPQKRGHHKEITRSGQDKSGEARQTTVQPTYIVVVDITLVLGQHRPGGQGGVANIAHKVAPPFVDGPHVGADVGRLGKGGRTARNCAWVSPRLFVNRPLVPAQWRAGIPVPKRLKRSSAVEQHSRRQARSSTHGQE